MSVSIASQPAPVQVKRVALLTAGGLAPCLSSAVGCLIERYTEIAPYVEIIAYRGGYSGLLRGDSFMIGRSERESAHLLHGRGGSPLGNSRVKLTNAKDCEKRGLVPKGKHPLQAAAEQLVKDKVDVLHTIGGDDTNTAAADLAAYLAKHSYRLTVLGLPKTIDNDVIPISQSLGAFTAAEEGAKYFRNIVADHTATQKVIVVHEVMGRNCGWLCAATAAAYMKLLSHEEFATALNQRRDAHEVHAVYIPELPIDVEKEAIRLKDIMNRVGVVNIFISEGAGAEAIAKQLRSEGKKVPIDAFGHIKLDAVNVGKWFGDQFRKMISAEKLLVQKSGYFARAAPANAEDLILIKTCADFAVQCAFSAVSGVVGHDEEQGNRLRAIEFDRIKGGKKFNTKIPWFVSLMKAIGQPIPAIAPAPQPKPAEQQKPAQQVVAKSKI